RAPAGLGLVARNVRLAIGHLRRSVARLNGGGRRLVKASPVSIVSEERESGGRREKGRGG
ncbi:hypothetical protein TorRG33x02_285030, partial [Trema orientale]